MEALTQFATSMTVFDSVPKIERCLDQPCAPETRFGSFLRQLRLSVSGKQAWLSLAVGCSDAAISFWETGARLPTPRRMAALLDVLSAAGVSTMELLDLRQRWQFERSNRGMTLT
jgi:DNA-binding transcriptional regulator YiaG